jgi:hypothetical protein
MASTIESVDNVRKPPPQDRVNETERSSSEQRRQQFKKTMKETMEEDRDQAKKDEDADAVILEQDQVDLSQKHPDRHEEEQTEPDDKEPEDNQKDKMSPDKHVDLKA